MLRRATCRELSITLLSALCLIGCGENAEAPSPPAERATAPSPATPAASEKDPAATEPSPAEGSTPTPGKQEPSTAEQDDPPANTAAEPPLAEAPSDNAVAAPNAAGLAAFDFEILELGEIEDEGEDESEDPMPAYRARYFRQRGDCNTDECAKPSESMPPGRVVSVHQEYESDDPFMYLRRGHDDELLLDEGERVVAMRLVHVGPPISVWSADARFAYKPRCRGDGKPCVFVGSAAALETARALHEPASDDVNIVFDPIPEDATFRVLQRGIERSSSLVKLDRLSFDPPIRGEAQAERVRHRGVSVRALGGGADFGLARLPDGRRVLWIFQPEARSGGVVLIDAEGNELSRVEGRFGDYFPPACAGVGVSRIVLPIVDGDSVDFAFAVVGSSIATHREGTTRQVISMDAPRFRWASAWVTRRDGERLAPYEGARNVARNMLSLDASSFRDAFETTFRDEREVNEAIQHQQAEPSPP